MLRLTLTPGEYFTVNGDVVIQLTRVDGERVHVAIGAPREMPVLRGAVLERQGGQRPGRLIDVPPKGHRSETPI